ncbi:MAG: hypothetical protein KBT20_04290 [Bacteroidales bacterium]|nr:hypothetical protein [Candidatus Liminaster caballi]
MTKEELINHIKNGNAKAIYKHVGECTNYFDYDLLDDIINQLDNRLQMDSFAAVASDEYDYYLHCRGELYDQICYEDEYGCPVPKHRPHILPKLGDIISRAISRKEMDAKYRTSSIVLTEEEAQKPIPTPAEWIETSKSVLDMMQTSNLQIEDCLNRMQSVSNQRIEQLKLLKDKSLTTLSIQFNDLNSQLIEVKEQLQKYKKWFEDWQKLKEDIASECYDQSDIQEAGGLDDPSLMYDAIQSIISGNLTEKQLKEENEKLRSQQEAWRERPEYKEEIAKLKNSAKRMISVDQIKEGILNQADEFNGIQDLTNFTLRVNKMLRNTAWDAMADDVEREAKESFKQNRPVTTYQFYNGSQNVEHIERQDNTYQK